MYVIDRPSVLKEEGSVSSCRSRRDDEDDPVVCGRRRPTTLFVLPTVAPSFLCLIIVTFPSDAVLAEYKVEDRVF